MNIITPTEIQAKSIPVLLNTPGDFIGLAQTGTGKTAAFGLPLLHHIDPEHKAVQAVVIAPTRELAQQIARAIEDFAKFTKAVKVEVVYGGAPIVNQIKSIERKIPHILVATPGRLNDLINRRKINLKSIDFVVLDEADEMLSMGFQEDLDKILEATGPEKTTWLFSATMPAEIRKIIKKYMHEPAEVRINQQQTTNENIDHKYVLVKRHDKKAALKRVLDSESDMYGLIFCRTRRDTQSLSESFQADGYPVEALHGDMSQAQRDAVMKRFKNGNVRVLMATDVAARGIDVDKLTHVIHYELPDDAAFYTHRSGRTARAGNKGTAIALVTPDSLRKLRNIERELKIKIEKEEVPGFGDIIEMRAQQAIDKLFAQPVNEAAQKLVLSIADQLADVSSSDVLIQYLSMEMERLGLSGEKENLNADESDVRGAKGTRKDQKGRRSEKGAKYERGSRSKGSKIDERTGKEMDRYYISVGKFDKITKGDLLKLVCDTSGLTSRQVGRIDMTKTHSFVEVDAQHATAFTKHFKGAKIGGRDIVVKKEN